MSQENAMQDDVVIDDNEEFVAPETGHVELVFQALGDTVNNIAGTEGLTTAQVYLHAVLGASGGLTYAESLKGAEGFFGNVKEGAKKAIDYIVKMVKSIWDFFFKRQGPEEAKETKDAISDKEKELDDVSKVKAGLKSAAAGEAGLVEEIEKATNISELNGASKAVSKKNAKAKQTLSAKIGQLVDSLQGEIKLAGEVEAEAKKGGDSGYISWASTLKGGVSNTQSLITSLKGVSDLQDLKAAGDVLNSLKGHVDVITRALEASANTRSKVQGMIDNLNKLDGNGSASEEQKKQGDKELGELKLFVKSAARYASLLKRTLTNIKGVNSAVGKVFGL